MKKLVGIAILILVATLAFANGDSEEQVAQAPQATGSEGSALPAEEFDKSVTVSGVTFSWSITGETLRAQMSAETEGWVSVGFDPSRQMADAGMIIGYVADGTVFVRDDYGIGAVRHGADTDNGGEDNVTDVSGSEENGVTTIRFTIPLNSGDDLDKVLSAGGTHKLIVAYGPDRADDFGTYHAGRGSTEIEL